MKYLVIVEDEKYVFDLDNKADIAYICYLLSCHKGIDIEEIEVYGES
jgi:hypothetical protein